MDAPLTDTIDKYGDPIAFRIRAGDRRGALLAKGGTIKVEARHMAIHQKEAVVTEDGGTQWRLASDEGRHLKGTDLAPFPLGYFNAGLQCDLYGRIRALAARRNIALRGVDIRLVNHYWLTGSFIHGTGEGHAEPPDVDVKIDSNASDDTIKTLVAAALDASPAMAYLRTPLAANTFALYVNGRRHTVGGIANSPATDVVDPYRVYTKPLRPLDPAARRDLIQKTGVVEPGEVVLAGPSINNKLIRNIVGIGHSVGADGLYEVDTFLGVPGGSHFKLTSDESAREIAPTGLALASAGIAFCYMTQLSRYIENMKMNIRQVRLVQTTAFTAGDKATFAPIDTHLYLNGEAPVETHLQLLTIAARTCYLHAAAKTPTEPKVRVVHNGQNIANAA